MIDWEHIFTKLRAQLDMRNLPSVSEIAGEKQDPFAVFVSTLISLRTKDSVTLAAGRRLLSAAPTPEKLAALPVEEIARLIYPAGFYRTKAGNLQEAARRFVRNGGKVPQNREELLTYPGVGIKTANLTLGLGYGQPWICVDTHVHRIANRIGWVQTGTPEETEKALEAVLPRKYRIGINGLLVAFGQQVCTPQSPHCSRCVIRELCGRNGVNRSR